MITRGEQAQDRYWVTARDVRVGDQRVSGPTIERSGHQAEGPRHPPDRRPRWRDPRTRSRHPQPQTNPTNPDNRQPHHDKWATTPQHHTNARINPTPDQSHTHPGAPINQPRTAPR